MNIVANVDEAAEAPQQPRDLSDIEEYLHRIAAFPRLVVAVASTARDGYLEEASAGLMNAAFAIEQDAKEALAIFLQNSSMIFAAQHEACERKRDDDDFKIRLRLAAEHGAIPADAVEALIASKTRGVDRLADIAMLARAHGVSADWLICGDGWPLVAKPNDGADGAE